MKYIAELAELLPAERSLCLGHRQIDRNAQRLLDYLRSSDGPTDPDAAEHLGFTPGSARYRKVKHRLKYALINQVTALRPSEASSGDRDQLYKYVWKLIAIGKAVHTTAGSEILVPYLEKALALAEEYQMVDAAFECATMLRRQYTNRLFDRKKYLHYREVAERYKQVSRDYQDVVSALNEVVYLRNLREEPALIRALALEYFAEFEPLIARHDSAMVSYIIFFIKVNAHLVAGEYRELVAAATRAIHYLDHCPTTQPKMYQVFEANLAVAYVQLNDHANGIDFARRLLTRTTPRDHNYIKGYELLLTLTLRAGRFQEAYDHYISIDRRTLEDRLLPYYRETFDIFEAYLHLLISLGKIKVDPENKQFTRFRINRFLNSFDHAAGEKRHRNVHLLIIKLMDHLVHRRHTQTLDSIEAITKYTQRYLRGHQMRRVRYFMKALAQLSAQSFHIAAVRRHTDRYLQQLHGHPITASRQDYSLELIPFELLWEMVLGQLGHKRITVKRD